MKETKKTDANSRQQSSVAIGSLFADAIAKQKVKSEAEAEQAIANTKAEYENQIAKVKSEAEEKAKALAEQTAQLKTELAEKEKAHAEQIAEFKAEAEQTIAEEKTRADEAAKQIAKVKTEAQEAIAQERAKSQAKAEEAGADEKEAATLTESKESTVGEVSETIPKMAQSLAELPGERSLAALGLCAKDIMQKEPVWGSPDDSVQQTLETTQQCDADYLLIGKDGRLEGIVSKSDLRGAISPYLRPAFAKWRRPLDDATLQIKVKLIMSKSVHTIEPETPLAAVMRNMCQFGLRALPVADQRGKVQGLITEVDIFKALLKVKSSPNISAVNEVGRGQPTSPHPADRVSTQLTRTTEVTLVHA